MKLTVRDVHADLTSVVFQEKHVLLHLGTFNVKVLHRVRLLLQKGKERGTVITDRSRKVRLRLLHLLRNQVGGERKRAILLLVHQGQCCLQGVIL